MPFLWNILPKSFEKTFPFPPSLTPLPLLFPVPSYNVEPQRQELNRAPLKPASPGSPQESSEGQLLEQLSQSRIKKINNLVAQALWMFILKTQIIPVLPLYRSFHHWPVPAEFVSTSYRFQIHAAVARTPQITH